MLGKLMLHFMGIIMALCHIIGSSPLVPDVFDSPKIITKFTIIHMNIGGQQIGWMWMFQFLMVTNLVDLGMGEYNWLTWSVFCQYLPMYISFLMVFGISLIYPFAPRHLGVALNYSLQLYQQLMKVYEETPELKENQKGRIVRMLRFFVYVIVIGAPLYTLFRIIHGIVDPSAIIFFGRGYKEQYERVGVRIFCILHNIYVHATLLPAFMYTVVTALNFVACGVLMTPFDRIELGGMRLNKEKFYRYSVVDVPLEVTYSGAGTDDDEKKSSSEKPPPETIEKEKAVEIEIEIDAKEKPKETILSAADLYKDVKDQLREIKDNESLNQHTV